MYDIKLMEVVVIIYNKEIWYSLELSYKIKSACISTKLLLHIIYTRSKLSYITYKIV